MTISCKKNAVLYLDSDNRSCGVSIRKLRLLKAIEVYNRFGSCSFFAAFTRGRGCDRRQEFSAIVRNHALAVQQFSSVNTYEEIIYVRELLQCYERVHIVSSWYHTPRIRLLSCIHLSDEDFRRVTVHSAMGVKSFLPCLFSLIKMEVRSYRILAHYVVRKHLPNGDLPNNRFRRLLGWVYTKKNASPEK